MNQSERPCGSCDVVVGLQWGDEGKGKIVDLLTRDYDATVRYNGGANAGHTVVIGGEKFAIHLVPSGILSPGKLAIIANGTVIDPFKLVDELDGLSERGVDISGLVISSRAHVVMPYHQTEDAFREDVLSNHAIEDPENDPDGHIEPLPEADVALAPQQGGCAIGTTRRGIGPCYSEKIQRAGGVRVGDLLQPRALKEKITYALLLKHELGAENLDDAAELQARLLAIGDRLRDSIQDTTYLLHEILSSGRSLLIEGANATLLDVDHGTYPYVTSSNSSVLGVSAGTGLPPSRIGNVFGVAKAYSTRVGRGPMPTEIHSPVGDLIRERGREYGTTTGRPRRIGWLDLVALRYAAMINGTTGIALTLLDVLAGPEGPEELHICTKYRLPEGETDRFTPDASILDHAKPILEPCERIEADLTTCRSMRELPPAARRYIERIEDFVGVPVRLVSVGPDREQTIHVESA